MSAASPPSEQELHDYVDGRLDRDRRAEVAAYLSHHPQGAALVEAYRAQNAGMRALYDEALDEPVPAAMLELLRRHQAGGIRRRVTLAAAAVLILLSSAAGWWLNDVLRGEEPLVAEARQAYQLYAASGRWASDVDDRAAPAVAQAVSRRLGAPVRLPDFEAIGFSLQMVRVLPAAGGGAAALTYRDGQGRAVVLFIAPSAAADRSARRLDRGDTVTLHRTTGHVFYGLTVPRDTVDAVEPSFEKTPG